MQESLRDLLRKKVLDMKADTACFYTETYNIVAVLLRLSPEAPQIINDRIRVMYDRPSAKYHMPLPQLEDLYAKFKGDFSVKIKTRPEMHFHDVKTVLDRVRRDLLFYLVLLEEPKGNYNIILDKIQKNDTDAGVSTGTPPGDASVGDTTRQGAE